MPALPAIVTDRLDRLTAILADAPANSSAAHPVHHVAWSYVVRDAVASVLMGVVEVTGWALQDAMPQRQAVMPISSRLYYDASTRGKTKRRDVANARAILEAYCAAVIESPNAEGLAAAHAQFLASTKGYWS